MMENGKPNGRGSMPPRVHGMRVPGAHPADVVIRRERYPYAAPSPVENLLYWLIGSPIASSRAMHERLSKVKALAVFSSDALSSVAYATEEILLVLILAGTGAIPMAGPIGVGIAVLLFIVAVSYSQTIHAYPTGGGSYIVAKDNLGVFPGLLAGAALLIDYVLTVAVSVSSGIAAVTSALPDVEPWRVPMAVLAVLLITVANLRGLRESSTIFMVPTYFFIVSIYAVIAVGLFRYFGLHQTQLAPTANTLPAEALEPLTILLVLKAFAAGCTALTGVEAISNGVPAFRPPEASNAARTLGTMAAILISMFLGITFLTQLYPVVPQADHETIISQLGRTAFGEGPAYWFLQASTTLILILAANTSFADFPRLSSIIARDGYLPRIFIRIGQRLVFSTGIMVLTILSVILIVAYGASTHNLIPLYAVGVFVSFTLSQAGMVQHWRKLRGPGWKRSMIINGIGAVTTAVVAGVIIQSKFLEGAWQVVGLIPILMLTFALIHRHYVTYREQVSLASDHQPVVRPNVIVVPIEKMNAATERTLEFAKTISGKIRAVHVKTTPEADQALVDECRQREVELELLDDRRRSVRLSLLDFIGKLGDERPEARIVVVVPERAPRHIWNLLTYNRVPLGWKLALLFQPKRIVVDVPYDDRFEQHHEHQQPHRNIVIIPVARVDRSTLRTLRFAETIQGQKTAVFINMSADEAETMQREWQALNEPMPLQLIESPYRSITGPLLKYIDRVSADNPDANVVVIIPEIIPKRRIHLLLHNQTMSVLKWILLFRPRNRILISVPFHLEK